MPDGTDVGGLLHETTQGSLFRKFRDVIMGHKHTDILKEVLTALPQERVGIRNEEGNNDKGLISNSDDGQTADVLAQKTLKKKTYAAVARRSSHYCLRINDSMNKKSERRRFLSSPHSSEKFPS